MIALPLIFLLALPLGINNAFFTFLLPHFFLHFFAITFEINKFKYGLL